MLEITERAWQWAARESRRLDFLCDVEEDIYYTLADGRRATTMMQTRTTDFYSNQCVEKGTR